MTDLKVELADCCPPMGISIDVITGAHHSRQDWNMEVWHPPMGRHPDGPNTGDPASSQADLVYVTQNSMIFPFCDSGWGVCLFWNPTGT
jgi:hypothetical protein